MTRLAVPRPESFPPREHPGNGSPLPGLPAIFGPPDAAPAQPQPQPPPSPRSAGSFGLANVAHVEPVPEGIPAHASSALCIDLDAVRTNYRALKMIAGRAECAGVVKADAYGLGIDAVLRALLTEQCRVFFVANVDEAWRVRQQAPQATIYVLNGLYPGTGAAFAELRALPVLGSVPEAREWSAFCATTGQRRPAAVHVDTGMNRLGLTAAELHALLQAGTFETFDTALILSHLASADQPGSTFNALQRQAFDAVRALFPQTPASLANSAGTLLGPAFHYDMVRPGIAVYGGSALQGVPNPMKSVVRLLARIVQLREIAPGEAVGYGQTFRAKRPTRLAVIAAGYADGLPRTMTNGIVAFRPGMSTAIAETVTAGVGPRVDVRGYLAPIVGRISMDLTALDVTDLPPGIAERGQFVELIGRNSRIDDLAAYADTIGYEVLTRLGRRSHRMYVGGDPVRSP